MAGAHTVEAVLQHQAVADIQPQAAGRFQKNVGLRFAVFDVGAADHIMEIPGRARGLQVLLDHAARAGTGHDPRDAAFFQQGQQFLEPRLAGHALREPLAADLPDLVQHLLGVHLGEIPPDMRPQLFPGQPPPPGIERRRILRHGDAQRLAGGLPQGIPQALRVKHQAVHIKNHTLDHRGAAFLFCISLFIVAHFARRCNRRSGIFPPGPAPARRIFPRGAAFGACFYHFTAL